MFGLDPELAAAWPGFGQSAARRARAPRSGGSAGSCNIVDERNLRKILWHRIWFSFSPYSTTTKVESPPQQIPLTFLSPRTKNSHGSAGASTFLAEDSFRDASVPRPSCPERPCPQRKTRPLPSSAAVCAAPHEMAAADAGRPSTLIGTAELVRDPWPSCPASPRPQVRRSPFAVRAAAWSVVARWVSGRGGGSAGACLVSWFPL